MNLLAGLHWLTSMTSRRKLDLRGTDFGDMGTAFGLDATLADTSAKPDASATPAQATPPADRLVRRPRR